ncbi:uncharacterized protein SEPMUDRAFT_114679 [Sphaerulina musiva SO2202]|uniref:Uncharacterized protein n=1 Tax=Sphaerulina musiva (strain SO2202) TaxID=692275 RepID=M3C5P2_SPHMS|nr:uncharacterized protein SEPMUDRAFT_114679 [Sphaerulina musiva SO2202]EMF15591.1 hypothetical protein SEPMUDRAFT_114679 [Sphaerulina musiva SO2202]
MTGRRFERSGSSTAAIFTKDEDIPYLEPRDIDDIDALTCMEDAGWIGRDALKYELGNQSTRGTSDYRCPLYISNAISLVRASGSYRGTSVPGGPIKEGLGI